MEELNEPIEPLEGEIAVPLSANQRENIIQLLNGKIEKKLKSYGRETISMPFLARLIQDSEKIAAYPFIHSLATSLGMSIYENVSVILASESADEAIRNYGVGGAISRAQKAKISDIIRSLRNGDRKPNIANEIEEVLTASTVEASFQKSGNVADFYMRRGSEEYYFEIKTVKPNIDVFEKSKTKLLEWVARRRKRINVFLAFPYNPYHPEPYRRFTEVGLMDPPNDFLVGQEYWNFIADDDVFEDLLATFDEVGKRFKSKLEEKFKEIARRKIDSY